VSWSSGDVVVRREVLNDGRCWLELPVIVVSDDPGMLATYIAPNAPMGYPLGFHPWYPKERWRGNGVLMLQRPGEMHAVWVFWHGDEREFAGWYVNLQEPFRRTAIGYDTYDLELDVWMPAAGGWSFKDDELLDVRVQEGRFTADEVAEIRALGAEIGAMLDRGEQWWDPSWSRWEPNPGWSVPAPGAGWEAVPTT